MEVNNQNRLVVWLGKMSVVIVEETESVVVFPVIFLLVGRLAVVVSAGSVSCRLGGHTACKWSCRLRGYIRGDCQGEAGRDTQCSCSQVRSTISKIDQLTQSHPITGHNDLQYPGLFHRESLREVS